MEKFTTVASFINPWEAHIAKGRLEAEGIRAYIAHEHHAWANWPLSQALGGVKVQVLTQDKEIADQIIRLLLDGEYENILKEENIDIENNVCPNCGSEKFASKLPFLPLVLALITLGFFLIIFPLRKSNHICSSCKFRWQY